jgi:hypothetical protein
LATGGGQAATEDVGLDLPVPLVRQEFLQPAREAVKILGRELGNGRLKLFETHRSPAYHRRAGTKRAGTYAPVVDQSADVTLINGPTMAAHPTNANVLYFTFGTSFSGYGTDLYRFDTATSQVTKTHNAYHGIDAFAFNPAAPSVMYLGLVKEQIQ